MNAVLYTCQLEPITVVDIPVDLWRRMARGERIVIAVMEPPKLVDVFVCDQYKPPRTVTIFGERIFRNGHETLMLFTGDEESALLLRADFLPGQRGELQNRERRAFAAGFIEALVKYGDVT